MIDVGAAPVGDGWDTYLRSHDGAVVYASSRFRALLCDLLDAEDVSLAARVDGEIRGVLPLITRDGIVNSLPYYGSNGGIYADDDQVAAALAAAYDDVARSRSTLAATLVENPFAGPAPRVASNLADERIAQWTELPATAVESSARRNVRKAQREGVAVEKDATAFTRLHELHDENIRALDGRPKSARFFELVPRHLREGEDFDLYVARLDGEVVAALLVLHFNAVSEYYTPAIEHDARPLQPLAAILDVALRDAHERGRTRWNWGGTWESQSGVHRFKRKWGAREGRYRYHVQVNDGALLDAAPAELLGRFPGFYVAPFSALHARA